LKNYNTIRNKRFRSPVSGYYIYCDVCGFKTKIENARMRWDNLLVCLDDWEPRHPQDQLPKPRTEKYPKLIRPEPEDISIDDRYPNGIDPTTDL
jgi:hypothetical protein